MRAVLVFAALVCPAWAHARSFSVAEVSNPQADHRGWVSDHADVLPADAELRMEALLEQLHADLGAEVVVVTVGDVDAPTPKDFATRLFNTWGIGDETANNGFLVLMVMDQRRIEMETGYGLEGVLPDGWLGRVRTEQMVPRFKAGDFAGGIEAGMIRIDARMREFPTEVREGTRREMTHVPERIADTATDGALTPAVTYGLAGGGLGATALVAGGAALAVRRRRRRCPTCKTQMRKLGEHEEDEHLDDAQELEEAIGSRQWSVYVCQTCDHTRTFKRDNWFSGHSTCPECARRTKTSTRTTLVAATQYSTGLVQIHQKCANCSYDVSFTRVTPQLPDPSDSDSGGSSGGYSGGSSGGGSFGGGSSGGGGGGSSW